MSPLNIKREKVVYHNLETLRVMFNHPTKETYSEPCVIHDLVKVFSLFSNEMLHEPQKSLYASSCFQKISKTIVDMFLSKPFSATRPRGPFPKPWSAFPTADRVVINT